MSVHADIESGMLSSRLVPKNCDKMTPHEISILSSLARLAVDDNINGRFDDGVAELSSDKAKAIANCLRKRDFSSPLVARLVAWVKQQREDSGTVVSY